MVLYGAMSAYCPRAVEFTLSELLRELPAIMIVGPRAAGKTTTAARYAQSIVRLDRAAEAAAFHADPDAALRGMDEPVLLDEWQAVPTVLGAVKRTVDAQPRPGRFILTGSVRADIDSETWAGTGRVVRLPMHPLTVAELRGRLSTPLLDRLANGDDLRVPTDAPDLRGYVELALRGGFPQAALARTQRVRERWLESYVDQLVTRDAMLIDAGRDPERLRRFFEAYALNSAGLADESTIFRAAGINRKTGKAYEQLLSNLMVVDTIPAWSSNRLKRLVQTPKRYLIDPSLLVGILRIDEQAVIRDGDLLGRVLDNFVAAQLRPEVTVAATRPRLHHIRQQAQRHEVDLVAELGGGRMVGLEVKAASAPDRHAARHLVWLRERLGERFVRGVVLHTGPKSYMLDERIVAAPICTLWA